MATDSLTTSTRDPYEEYLGEAVEPWSYLKSAYWKAAGYPEGLYRVGPLARLNVIDRLGTEEADAEFAEYRERLGRYPSSSFHYHYARLVEILHCVDGSPSCSTRRTSSTRTCSPAPTSTATKASASPKRRGAR